MDRRSFSALLWRMALGGIGIHCGVIAGIGNDASNPAATTASFDITLLDSADPVAAGAPFAYTVQINNTSAIAGTNVSAVVTLDASLAFVSASGSGWTCSNNAGVVTCTRATLVLGSAPPITINVTAGNVSTTANTSMTCSADNATQVAASQQTTIVRPTWSVVFAAPAAVQDNTNYTYTATVTNNGAGVIKNASLTFALDANVTWVSSTGADWTLAHPNGSTVTATMGSLPVGTPTPIVVTVTAPVADTALTTTFTGTATNAANLSASANTASLTITKDGPQNVMRPASLNEWVGAAAAIGANIVPPQFYFRLQEASGDVTDDMQGSVMTKFGAPTYQNAFAGWTSKTINTTDGTSLEGFGSGQLTLFNLPTQSMVMLVYAGVTADANRRSLFTLSGTSVRVDILSTGKIQLAPGSTNGGVNYKDSLIHPFVVLWQPGTGSFLYDGAGVFTFASDKEKVVGTWNNTASGGASFKGLGAAGVANTQPPGAQWNMMAAWIGSAADAMIAIGPKAMLQALNWTVTGY